MTLEQAIQSCKDLSEWFETYGVGTELCEYGEEHRQIAEWLEDYKELKEATRLIPCSEKMPKKDGEYLCVSNGEFKILPYRNGEFYCTCFDAVLRCCNSSVTHWMPLPETPKGDAE